MIKGSHLFTRVLDDTFWRWIVTVDIPNDTANKRREFINWMTDSYGKEGTDWSIRWSNLGVDIRFHNEKDYFKFMFFDSN